MILSKEIVAQVIWISAKAFTNPQPTSLPAAPAIFRISSAV